MATKYTCFDQKKGVFSLVYLYNVLFSKQFFLLTIALILLYSLLDQRVNPNRQTVFLHSKDGKLVIKSVKETDPKKESFVKIDWRPFLFQKIPVNLATLERIQSIPGVGLKKATAIINTREQGMFLNYHDLVRVRGIGVLTAKKLNQYFSFETQ